MMWTYFHVSFDIGLGEFIDGWAFNIQRLHNDILENNNHIHFNTFYRPVWYIVSTKNEPSYIMHLVNSKLLKSLKLTNDHKFKNNFDLGSPYDTTININNALSY